MLDLISVLHQAFPYHTEALLVSNHTLILVKGNIGSTQQKFQMIFLQQAVFRLNFDPLKHHLRFNFDTFAITNHHYIHVF